MQDFTLLLDLKCIDAGIIQLSNFSFSAIEKQFKSLDSRKSRQVSRKIKKLAKKAIKALSHDDAVKLKMMKDCGFGARNCNVSRTKKRHQRRNRLHLVRRLFTQEVLGDLRPRRGHSYV